LAFKTKKVKTKYKNSALCLSEKLASFYTLRFIHKTVENNRSAGMKQIIFLLTLLLVGCNTTPSSDKSQEAVKSDSVEIEQLPTELFVEEREPKKNLYLNGIYEYDYPHDTEDMNENQYIAFKKEGDSIQT
jgi:hypothetical protein